MDLVLSVLNLVVESSVTQKIALIFCFVLNIYVIDEAIFV